MSRYEADTFKDFICVHCKRPVTADTRLAGVQNRNHCPYCLSSRHLDQFQAGDRLAACMGRMRPVGLTFKKVQKKYARPGQGELMLIHSCDVCAKLSINRIAADDDTDQIMAVFAQSHSAAGLATQLAAQDILLAGADELDLVRAQLFGKGN